MNIDDVISVDILSCALKDLQLLCSEGHISYKIMSQVKNQLLNDDLKLKKQALYLINILIDSIQSQYSEKDNLSPNTKSKRKIINNLGLSTSMNSIGKQRKKVPVFPVLQEEEKHTTTPSEAQKVPKKLQKVPKKLQKVLLGKQIGKKKNLIFSVCLVMNFYYFNINQKHINASVFLIINKDNKNT